MWGIRAFFCFCPEECGALVGDSFQSKMAAIIPTRTSGNISAHRTQVFTGICGIRRIVRQIYTPINLGHGFKQANALILRCQWVFVPLLRKDNFSEYLWNVMTKIVLKLNCGDPNPPFLAENLPFLENIFDLPFSLNILLVFETLPS